MTKGLHLRLEPREALQRRQPAPPDSKIVLRLSLFVAAVITATPVAAEPAHVLSRAEAAALIDPVTLKVNEVAAKQIEAQTKARDVAWDLKIRRTMSGVCRGC